MRFFQRRAHRQAYQSDDSESEGSRRSKSPKRLRKGGAPTAKDPPPKQASPAAATQAKRKKSMSAQPLPPSKRARSETTSGEDPARKYCLTKLQELFCQIFTRYPFLEQGAVDGEMPSALLQPQKKTEELTDEEKEALKERAQQFSTDLEQCMFDLYSEPGEGGRRVVAGKYK